MAEITVLIPTYNSGVYLVQAVESVFQQTETDWQLIILDDASTDQSISLLNPFLADPRVTLLQSLVNIGQSKILNQGLERTVSPFVVQLDGDDWLPPHTLTVLLDEAKKTADHVAVICGNVHIVFEDEVTYITGGITYKSKSYHNGYEFMLQNTTLLPRCYKTSILKTNGGWRTDVPYEGRYMEDKLLLFKLITHYNFHWVDKILYYHRRHRDNQTNQSTIYAEITEWAVRDALKSWGDRYEPVFMTLRNGHRIVTDLLPRNSGSNRNASLSYKNLHGGIKSDYLTEDPQHTQTYRFRRE